MMIQAYNRRDVLLFIRDRNPLHVKVRLFPEDTNMLYSGFEPTRLQVEGRIYNTGWAANTHCTRVAAVAEWYRHRIVAGFVTSSSPVPLKTRRVGQRCTLNLSRAETSSRWCGVVVRRGGASSGVVHVT
ncbi:uncharacterized protein TNCV_519371 [Trichonephila clavipes]|nr:uncharacterized protein TNCV_519371 [Trichonephila clavipes]